MRIALRSDRVFREREINGTFERGRDEDTAARCGRRGSSEHPLASQTLGLSANQFRELVPGVLAVWPCDLAYWLLR